MGKTKWRLGADTGCRTRIGNRKHFFADLTNEFALLMPVLRQIPWKEFEAFLRSVGCSLVREAGDHRIWQKDGLRRPIVVPKYNPLPIFIVKNNLRILGISTK